MEAVNCETKSYDSNDQSDEEDSDQAATAVWLYRGQDLLPTCQDIRAIRGDFYGILNYLKLVKRNEIPWPEEKLVYLGRNPRQHGDQTDR